MELSDARIDDLTPEDVELYPEMILEKLPVDKLVHESDAIIEDLDPCVVLLNPDMIEEYVPLVVDVPEDMIILKGPLVVDVSVFWTELYCADAVELILEIADACNPGVVVLLDEMLVLCCPELTVPVEDKADELGPLAVALLDAITLEPIPNADDEAEDITEDLELPAVELNDAIIEENCPVALLVLDEMLVEYDPEDVTPVEDKAEDEVDPTGPTVVLSEAMIAPLVLVAVEFNEDIAEELLAVTVLLPRAWNDGMFAVPPLEDITVAPTLPAAPAIVVALEDMVVELELT